MIKVTILTVAYNSEATIAKTIESVLNQTYSCLEYIILDGDSEDGTVRIAEKYKNRFEDKAIDYKIVSEPDEGMYDALNKGIKMASGALIGSINADDWYESEFVQQMVAHYEQDKYDIAWGSIVIHKKSGNMIKKAKNGKLKTTSGFCHPAMCATKDVLIEIPYANRQMDDDFDMLLRAFRLDKKVYTYPEVLSNYSFGGMSTQKSLKNMNARIQMKYQTYRRNGYSVLYWFYCAGIEIIKYIMG